jgi:hypothetical protein
MKLTQFALAAIIVLLAVAGYLTIKSDLDSRLETQNAINDRILARVEELAQKNAQPVAVPAPPPAAAPAAPAPIVAPVPPPPRDPAAAAALAAAANIPPGAPMAREDDPRMLEDERSVLNLGAPDRVATDSLNLPSTLEGQALTKIQQRIVALPAIARVKEYAEKQGMLVLDRGTNANLRPGDQFALRRKSAIIGRIRISETIEATESIADILPGSMPVGMLPAAEDDVVQFDQ